MVIPLDPKQVVSFEELLMSQVVQQEALNRLLVEKGIFTKKEFLKW
jgi:beta-N-acetylglucosaminidase